MARRSFFCCILPLLLASCTKNASYQNATVIAVNGQALTASGFGRSLGRKLKLFDALAAKDPTNIKKTRETVVQEFIVSALLTQYAKAHDISVTQTEVDGEFDRVRKTYPDDMTFKAALATEGQSIDEWRRSLEQTLLERKVFSALTPNTPNDLKADLSAAHSYYEEHGDDFNRPAQIRLQQIVVTREDDAERILHKLKGGVSFTELAQKFSISPDGAQGGDIGFISKGTIPAFDSAFTMKVGQPSGVIKSSYGFHIMKVLDKRPADHLSFDQVREKLLRDAKTKRQQASFNQWLETAVKMAKIERNDALLEKIRIRTEGDEE